MKKTDSNELQNAAPHNATAPLERPRIKPPTIRPRPKPGAPAEQKPKRPADEPSRKTAPGDAPSERPSRERGPGGPGGPKRPRRDRRDRMPGGHPGAVKASSAGKFGPSKSLVAQESAGGAAAIKPNPDAVRFVPLGGLEEVGRNCMFLEYKNEIVIIDVGLQFPEDETPGIDYIIPNIQYLEKKKENIAGDHFDARPLRPYRRVAALARTPRQSPDLRDIDHESDHRKTAGRFSELAEDECDHGKEWRPK